MRLSCEQNIVGRHIKEQAKMPSSCLEQRDNLNGEFAKGRNISGVHGNMGSLGNEVKSI